MEGRRKRLYASSTDDLDVYRVSFQEIFPEHKQEARGTLYACRAIAYLHDADLWINDEPDSAVVARDFPSVDRTASDREGIGSVWLKKRLSAAAGSPAWTK